MHIHVCYTVLNILHSIHHFRSSKQCCTKHTCAVSPWGESVQNLLCKLPHLFTVQNVYLTRISFFNQYAKAKFGREDSTFLNFSLWNFIDCGSWTIQCLKINNFKVSLTFYRNSWWLSTFRCATCGKHTSG